MIDMIARFAFAVLIVVAVVIGVRAFDDRATVAATNIPRYQEYRYTYGNPAQCKLARVLHNDDRLFCIYAPRWRVWLMAIQFYFAPRLPKPE